MSQAVKSSKSKVITLKAVRKQSVVRHTAVMSQSTKFDLEDHIRVATANSKTERKGVICYDSDEEKTPIPMGLGASLRGMFPKFRTRLGLLTTLASTVTSGLVSVSYNVNSVAGIAEFSSWANLFDEFFVHSMTIHYEPIDAFQSPYLSSVLSTPVTGATSVPCYIVSLYHAAATYGTPSPMANNSSVKVVHTARPWTHVWKNNENPKAGVLPAGGTGSTLPTQGWCLTSATPASNYTGTAQLFGHLATIYPASTTLGTITLFYDVTFRARA
jgi:hypothetical protein